jgi:GNAT superfamily N-acetyltransferase
MDIREATTREDILKCWDVIYTLRPHLVQEAFADTVLEMFQQGYHLAFIEHAGKAVAAVGYRYQHFLYNGKHIYIDDLVTLPQSRGKGLGAALLNYVSAQASAKGLTTVTLDSGYQRKDAHRLYLNNGFVMTCHHFEKSLL